ncbi:hypothetical protein K437DRAFT_157937 [Tilletiaria anomala UBC 951]|uniref:Amine oxidase domain-containing protein n=1 Tax=Tilletiaria anomala (strain ATCC 24038 / CBS 436.72 / UBC 951) TaxID=1037660 RepID=A0A066VR35_TILAU|nr:uncharacterized protein K437DRAFT_157937 [Tilletiaria anomala UBC 951]KDN42733.1 hypothetical protein K437DRAFT_157937 [Tilletiaria anomala UBC 951]
MTNVRHLVIHQYGGEDAVVTHGCRQLIDWTWRQAEKEGAELILDSKVTQIARQNDDDDSPFAVQAVSLQGDQMKFHSDFVICSLPLGVLQKEAPAFKPPLPLRKQGAIERLGFGLLNKIVLTYSSPWWR